MQVIKRLIAADGVHIRVQPLSHREAVALQRLAFPLGQGVHHLHIRPRLLHVKAHGPLDAVEVIVQPCRPFNKQRGRYPLEVQRFA